jgi:tRNA pseudouridine13 synthase
MIAMLSVAEVENSLGIEVFVTTTKGIGGIIRQRYEDFAVKEIPASTNQLQSADTSEGKGPYSVFWLEKRGLDTILAIKKIAKSLKISQKRFSFAGMKDKNALTLQRVSAWNVPPEKLIEVNLTGIRIREAFHSDSRISIGSHLGNQFSIVVRKIHLPLDEMERRIHRISNEMNSAGGAPNFFGHQRFGLIRPITHIVGLKILKGDFEDAAMVFLSRTSPHEKDQAIEARAELGVTKDFKSAITKFPTQLTYELALLHRLSSSPNNFANAFRALPRRLLQMFVSAAQGWLFNRFVSRRLRDNISLNQCLIGDLAAFLDADGLTLKELITVDSSNIDETNKNLKENKAAIVYPVPGFDMKLPKGTMQETVKEIMTQEDLTPRSFWISKMPEISSSGIFRPIAMIPKNLKITPFSSNSTNELSATFDFSLIRGSYATILLREFMKNVDPLVAGY